MTDPEKTTITSPTESEYKPAQPLGDARPTVTIALPKGWARAALSGIEAALLGWALPALIAITGLLVEGTNPWLRGIEVSAATAVGTDFWALSLGSPIVLGGLTISLMPLLWTVAQVVILRGLLYSSRSHSPAALWAAIPLFALTNLIILLATTGSALIAPVLLGSLAVSFTGVVWALLAQSPSYPTWFTSLNWVWSGIRTGAWWFFGAVLLSLGALLFSVVSNFSEMQQVASDLGATGLSGAILSAIQMGYIPVMAAWVLSWLSGAGFQLADAQVHTPVSTFDSVLPSFPVAQMLPDTEVGSQVIWFVLALGLCCGALTSWLLRRLPYLDVLRRSSVALLFFSFLIGIWFVLSKGSLGVNRLANLGPVDEAWPLVVLEVAVLAVAVIALTHGTALKVMSAGATTAYVFLVGVVNRAKTKDSNQEHPAEMVLSEEESQLDPVIEQEDKVEPNLSDTDADPRPRKWVSLSEVAESTDGPKGEATGEVSDQPTQEVNDEVPDDVAGKQSAGNNGTDDKQL